ncbi:hypothetical protein SRABI128_05296 [Microbacterium sp. Bi128]|nr:hypothetical protein SRABI128_05296 [Microbacterium sp. Bi128]
MHAELAGAVLPRDLTDAGIHPGVAQCPGEQFAETRKPPLGPGNRVRIGFQVVDDEGSLVVRRRAASGLADQRLEAQLPAGVGGGLEAWQVRVALAEGDRGNRPVQPQGGTQRAGFDLLEEPEREVEVGRGAK